MRLQSGLRRLTFVAVIGVAACGASNDATVAPSPNPNASPAPSLAASPSPTERIACTNPEGGACLGPVNAGTYTTQIFQPTLTYTVPGGWANYEDTAGNFLLVAPGYDLRGVNAGTSDYVGVYTRVAAMGPDCKEGPDPSVGPLPADIAAWAADQPGLQVTAAKAVSVGSLDGVVFDVTLAPGWARTCPFAPNTPVNMLITGLRPSDLGHGLIAGLTIRLYLLEYRDGSLAIEVDDVSGGSHLAALDDVARTFAFNP